MADRRLRVGVIGTGMIAQIMHLPYLRELGDLFDLRALCDSSRMVLDHCGRRFGVERLFTDWRQLLEEDLDAVVVLTSGSHARVAIAAADAGLHVLVEKPMCFSSTEGIAMLEAAARSTTVLMVGYSKRYDPGFGRARELIDGLEHLSFVRLTTIEAPFEPFVAHHGVLRGNDAGAEEVAKWRAESEHSVDEAIGMLRDDARVTYHNVLLDTMVHEFNLLRGLLGEPAALRFASLQPARVTVVLDFGGVECIVAWLDLPGMADYEMEACFYSPSARVRLAFGSPYLKNTPASLEMTTGKLGSASSILSRDIVSYEEAFKLELLEFHRATRGEADPLASAFDALRDVALCQSVVASARSGACVPAPTELHVGQPAR